jgi:succinate dehydrogenase/fumarate reductase flavoprotein subunit
MAAWHAAQAGANVLVLGLGGGASGWLQGLNVAHGHADPRDSTAVHAADILREGAGINRPDLVSDTVERAIDGFMDLVGLGVPFARDAVGRRRRGLAEEVRHRPAGDRSFRWRLGRLPTAPGGRPLRGRRHLPHRRRARMRPESASGSRRANDAGRPTASRVPPLELADRLLVAELILTAARGRQESRGTHMRRDFPQPAGVGEQPGVDARRPGPVEFARRTPKPS